MIRIIEEIKDFASGVYFDYITDKELNGKDPNYFGEVSDKIAKELFDFFSDLIAEEFLIEAWTSNNNLKSHFKKHCVGNGKKSNKKNIKYDFTTIDEYKDYEDEISRKVLQPDYRIVSLFDTVMVFSALSEITNQSTSVLFDIPCGFKNSNGIFQIGLNSFANGVTTNYGFSNTINLMILSKSNRTVSMYPIDSTLIEKKFKNIISKYISDKNIRKLYKK